MFRNLKLLLCTAAILCCISATAAAVYYEGGDVRFSWPYNPEKVTYIMEIDDAVHISGDAKWHEPFFRIKTIFNHYEYFNFPQGTFYWHILVYDSYNNLITYTAPKSFVVNPQPSYYFPTVNVPEEIGIADLIVMQKESRATLETRVIDSSGAVVVSAIVRAFNVTGANDVDPYKSSVESDGQVVFSDLPSGAYNLYIDAPGYSSQQQRNLSIEPGSVRISPTVILSPANGEIIGQVVNANGAPIQWAAVRLHNILTPAAVAVIPTNINGAFRFTQIPDGIYRIYYDAKGYSGQMQDNIPVSSGITRTPQVILKTSS